MRKYKLVQIIILFLVHLIWSILIAFHQLLNSPLPFITNRSYNLNILFDNTIGIKNGTSVHYRGVNIGEVISITLYSDYVIVRAYIKSANILIPFNAYAKTYKTIFMAETTLYIHHQTSKIPYSEDTIIRFCQNNDFIYGFQGASFDHLIDTIIRFSIQLDYINIIDLLYNFMSNLSLITLAINREVLK